MAEVKTKVTYSGDDATSEWLQFLAKQPGEVWIENSPSGVILVHEFNDLTKTVHTYQE